MRNMVIRVTGDAGPSQSGDRNARRDRGTGRGMNRNLRIAAAILALALPVTLVGCSQSDQAAKAASKKKAAAPAPIVKITPVANARSLPVTTEITAHSNNGAVYAVTLTNSNGQAVSGAFRPDDSSWVPSASLKFGQTYTAA